MRCNSMKVKVFTGQPLKVTDLKKVINIIQQSQCPNESLSNTFPDRYCGIKYPDKKSVNVFFDAKKASSHCYSWEW